MIYGIAVSWLLLEEKSEREREQQKGAKKENWIYSAS